MATEKRLIYVNDILLGIETFKQCYRENESLYSKVAIGALEMVAEFVNRTPTVDAVEVVRCKDCTKKIWCEDERLYWCAECHYRCNDGEWYCAGGERKGDG